MVGTEARLVVEESTAVVVVEESGTTVAGLTHAQPLEIRDASVEQPLAMPVGVAIGTPAWYAAQNPMAALPVMARRQLSFECVSVLRVNCCV